MGGLRPFFGLGEKTQSWHCPMCWIECLMPMGCSAVMFVTGSGSSGPWCELQQSRRGVSILTIGVRLVPRRERRGVDAGCWCPWRCPTFSHRSKCHWGSLGLCHGVPSSPLAQLGLTPTPSPKMPGKAHAVVEASAGISVPVEGWEVWRTCPAEDQLHRAEHALPSPPRCVKVVNALCSAWELI